MQAKLDVIANNLANTETTGFKADRAQLRGPLLSPGEISRAPRTAAGRIRRRASPSAPAAACRARRATSRKARCSRPGISLDVAIQGQGFFQIKDPSGTIYYTRAGNFSQNSNGQIVMGSANIGRLLEPAITIPADATNDLHQHGRRRFLSSARESNAAASRHHSVGQFHQSPGPAEDRRKPVPGNRGLGHGARPPPRCQRQRLGTTQQGSLEQSNVDPVSSLIDLITTQRAFEMNSQTIQAGNEFWQTINNLIK